MPLIYKILKINNIDGLFAEIIFTHYNLKLFLDVFFVLTISYLIEIMRASIQPLLVKCGNGINSK